MVFSPSFVLIVVVASFLALLFDLGSLLLQIKAPAAFLWLFAGWVSILALASILYTFVCAHFLGQFFRDWMRQLRSEVPR